MCSFFPDNVQVNLADGVTSDGNFEKYGTYSFRIFSLSPFLKDRVLSLLSLKSCCATNTALPEVQWSRE